MTVMTERKHYIVESAFETSSMGREERYTLRFFEFEEDAVQAFEATSTVLKGKLIDLWTDMNEQGSVTIKAFCYALPIPTWVAQGHEDAFIMDMLPDRLIRLQQAVDEVQTVVLQLQNRGDGSMFRHREVQP